MRSTRWLALGASAALLAGAAACGNTAEDQAATGEQGGSNLSGTIRIDGSSTVAPLSEAAAELFQQQHPDVRVSVGTSGTGGGFEKFCRGETDISDASREIEDDEEEACAEQNIEFEEITVANDALSVVVNPENDWADCLSVEQLSDIWDRGSDVRTWSDVDGRFPNEEVELFGPGTDSGTFDYFTEAVNGEEGRQRTDFNNVGEDDNAAVTGVGGSRGGMGYLGLSFVKENQDRIKAIQVRNDEGRCVEPSDRTVQDGSYQPLGRQLFVYPSDRALQRPEVREFLEFYIDRNEEIVQRAQFIALTQEQLDESRAEVRRLADGGGSPEGEEGQER